MSESSVKIEAKEIPNPDTSDGVSVDEPDKTNGYEETKSDEILNVAPYNTSSIESGEKSAVIVIDETSKNVSEETVADKNNDDDVKKIKKLPAGKPGPKSAKTIAKPVKTVAKKCETDIKKKPNTRSSAAHIIAEVKETPLVESQEKTDAKAVVKPLKSDKTVAEISENKPDDTENSVANKTAEVKEKPAVKTKTVAKPVNSVKTVPKVNENSKGSSDSNTETGKTVVDKNKETPVISEEKPAVKTVVKPVKSGETVAKSDEKVKPKDSDKVVDENKDLEDIKIQTVKSDEKPATKLDETIAKDTENDETATKLDETSKSDEKSENDETFTKSDETAGENNKNEENATKSDETIADTDEHNEIDENSEIDENNEYDENNEIDENNKESEAVQWSADIDMADDQDIDDILQDIDFINDEDEDGMDETGDGIDEIVDDDDDNDDGMDETGDEIDETGEDIDETCDEIMEAGSEIDETGHEIDETGDQTEENDKTCDELSESGMEIDDSETVALSESDKTGDYSNTVAITETPKTNKPKPSEAATTSATLKKAETPKTGEKPKTNATPKTSTSAKTTPSAPAKTTTSAPAKTTPSAPAKTTTSAPAKTTTSSPAKTTTSAPAKTTTSAPAKTTTSSPAKATTSAPAKTTTSAPAKTTTSAPAKATTSAPAKTTTSAPAKTTTSAPAKTTTSAPAKATTSAPAKTTTSAPAKTTTSATPKTTTSAPAKTTASAPAKTTSSAPAKTTTSATPKTTSATPKTAETPKTNETPKTGGTVAAKATPSPSVQDYTSDEHTPLAKSSLILNVSGVPVNIPGPHIKSIIINGTGFDKPFFVQRNQPNKPFCKITLKTNADCHELYHKLRNFYINGKRLHTKMEKVLDDTKSETKELARKKEWTKSLLVIGLPKFWTMRQVRLAIKQRCDYNGFFDITKPDATKPDWKLTFTSCKIATMMKKKMIHFTIHGSQVGVSYTTDPEVETKAVKRSLSENASEDGDNDGSSAKKTKIDENAATPATPATPTPGASTPNLNTSTSSPSNTAQSTYNPFKQGKRMFWKPVDVYNETYGLSRQFLQELGVKPPLMKRINVKNVNSAVTQEHEEELRNIFSLAGQVREIAVIKKRAITIVIVEYDHPIEAVQAISMFNKRVLCGQEITVEFDLRKGIYLPHGLQSIGPGFGPNGTPLTCVRQHVEMRPLKNALNELGKQVFSDFDRSKYFDGSQNSQTSQKAVEWKTDTNQDQPTNDTNPQNVLLAMLGAQQQMNQAQTTDWSTAMQTQWLSMMQNMQAMSQMMNVPQMTDLMTQANLTQNLANQPSVALNQPSFTPNQPSFTPNQPSFTPNNPTSQFNIGLPPTPSGKPPQEPPKRFGGPQSYKPAFGNTSNAKSKWDCGPAPRQPRPAPAHYSAGPVPSNPNLVQVVRKGFSSGVPPSEPKKESCDTLVFSYLPPSVTAQALNAKMREVGEVMFGEMTGLGRALVRFKHERDAERCMKLFDGSKVDGQIINVKYMKSM